MFFCTECGAETSKWSGKCPFCEAWNSLKESSKVTGKKTKKPHFNIGEKSKPEKIANITLDKKERIATGIAEFDGVLGGGVVAGMVVLIGGAPGIGKSTLMLQIANKLADSQNKKILYISGEESEQQIKMRSKRLQCAANELYLYCETNFEEIINTITAFQPDLVVIDSIQAIHSNTSDSAPGSVSQLRECTSLFTRTAKKLGIPFFLIGHITKDGAVAGPKIIEHMVDTVLYFEGEMNNKILRTTKNRFGSTNEIGIFEMHSSGLKEVKNPSQLFLNRNSDDVGTAIGSLLEGSRAFMVEVQALVSPANYGNSQRVTLGFDRKKLAVLLAVIEKNLALDLRNNDIFAKLSGGIKVVEPALDLAIVAAILSSFKETPISPNTIFLGEIGLNGEIRPVSQINKRLKEAEKMGFNHIIVANKLTNKNATQISHICQLMKILFQKK